MKFKKFHFLVLVFFLLISACGENRDLGNKLEPQKMITIPTATTTEDPETKSNTYMKQLKQNIIAVMNNEMWFKGSYSEFRNFESQKINIEIYTFKSPEIISVIFDKKGKDSNGIEQYFAIGFGLDDKFGSGQGVTQEIAGVISDESLEGLRNQLTSKDMGYVFSSKDEVQFDKITEPKFPQVSSAKKEVIQEISEYVTKMMKNRTDRDFPRGKYNLYIRNFSDKPNRTYVVCEDANGMEWLLNVIIRDEQTTIDMVEQPEKMDTEALKYLANQYKKISIQTVEVTL